MNKRKTAIGLSTGEVLALPSTRNDILLYRDILLDSDGKIQMQNVVYVPHST